MPLPSRSGPTLNLSRTQSQLAQPKAPRKLYKTVPGRTSLAEDDQDLQTRQLQASCCSRHRTRFPCPRSPLRALWVSITHNYLFFYDFF